MNTVSHDVRMDVARLLYLQYQKLTARLNHDPEAREEFDRALSLVLNKKWKADNPKHLLRNVRRDARRIHRRRQSSLPAHEQFDVLEDIIDGGFPNPEQQLLAKERYQQLAAIARDIGDDATGCLEGLLEKDSIKDTMVQLGLDKRRVLYMRSLLRTRLAERICAEEAA